MAELLKWFNRVPYFSAVNIVYFSVRLNALCDGPSCLI